MVVRGRASFEALDDDHAAAAAGAAMLGRLRLIGIAISRFDGINGNYRQREQLTGASDVVGTFAAGEQAIVADAVEACGHHVLTKPDLALCPQLTGADIMAERVDSGFAVTDWREIVRSLAPA